MSHRDALLAAARRCLEEKGYSRTTARDLTAASGANLASIGYHFGSKEALLNEAIAVVFADWTNQIIALSLSDPDATPLERLVVAVQSISERVTENRALLLAFCEALAQAERNPELRDQLAASYLRCRDTIAAEIHKAFVVDDEVRTTLASVFMSLFDGLSVQHLLTPEKTPSGDQIITALAQLAGNLEAS